MKAFGDSVFLDETIQFGTVRQMLPDPGIRITPPTAPRAAFAPWDRRQLPGLFSVEESARRVGNYKWVEMRLFEALGGWVATVPELDVKMRLGTHCYHHAWHSELWHKRLPELREMNPERLTVPPNDEMVAFVDAMTELLHRGLFGGRPARRAPTRRRATTSKRS